MFEGGGSRHPKGTLQLSDQLPGIQSITQVDKSRGTVDHWGAASKKKRKENLNKYLELKIIEIFCTKNSCDATLKYFKIKP